MPMSKVIAAKYVLGPENGRQAVLKDHYVYLEGAVIAAVTKDRPAGTDEVLRFEHGLVTPGFVNLHSHCLNGALFRGIPDDLSLDPWMPELIYKILMPLGEIASRELTQDELRAVISLGLVDVLKGGSTTVMDMWHHGQEVFFEVAQQLGSRVVGAPYIMSTSKLGVGSDGMPEYEFKGDGLAQLAKSIELFRKFDEGRTGRVQVALGPHALDTCRPELLREVRKAADQLGCVVTTHLAQTPEEVKFLRKHYDKAPVQYAEEAGILGEDVVLAHCVRATDDELTVLAATKTSVANCVVSFAREGVNVPYARFANAGVNTGIGTDSHGMNFVSELRTAGFFSKLHFKKGDVATAYQLFNAGTKVGADALKRPDLGRIAAGAKADLLVFDLFKAHLQPVWDPVKNVIWKGTSADIALVMVHGQPVVERGRLLTADEGEIIEAASKAARKSWEMATDQNILPRTPF